MITPLLAALALQTAQPEHQLFCIADPATGDIEVTLLFRAPGGPWRTSQNSRDGEVVDVDRLPQGEGRDWFDARAPIMHDGITYKPGDGNGFSVGGAVRRYFRHVDIYKGAPLFSVWPGGDIDLAVLERAEDCVFRVYSPEARPGA